MNFDGKKVYTNSRGYQGIVINRRWIALHQYVWQKEKGAIPKGFDIHHLNENRADNRIENLEASPMREHRSIHARERVRKERGWIKIAGEWVAKKCNRCAKVKGLEAFRIEKKTGWIASKCRRCETEKGTEWRLKNREKYRELSRNRMRLIRAKEKD